MSDNKKYYYLKVKDTFFDSEEMKYLESMKNGEKYQNLYLKLCLLSVKSDGLLLFKNAIPYDLTMISTVLRVDIDTINSGLVIFKKIGLVSKMDNGTIFMSDIQTLIGRSSTEAERIKSYRERTKRIEECNKSVQMYEKCTPEIEIDIEKEIDIETNKKSIRKKNIFIPPTLDEVQKYITEKELSINAQTFHSFYSKLDWKDSQGKQVKSWKGKAVSWDNREVKPKTPFPTSSIPEPPRMTRCPACGGNVAGFGCCDKCGIEYDTMGRVIG